MSNRPTTRLDRLRLEGLRNRVVGPVDMTVAAGERVCLSGPSGAGKTLLLRAVADLDPHEGRVWLDGRAADELPAHEWRQRVGYLPAESQWWAERVGDHFSAIDSATLAALGFTDEVMGWEVSRCSTGERQRLSLVRLLMNEPRVLLLDEPTASLDPDTTLRAEALILGYSKAQGVPVLWVSHDPQQIRRVAQRHFRIQGGRLQEVAS